MPLSSKTCEGGHFQADSSSTIIALIGYETTKEATVTKKFMEMVLWQIKAFESIWRFIIDRPLDAIGDV